MGEGVTGPVDVAPLFRPLTVGSVTLPNRFVLPGMQRRWVVGGSPLARLGSYYRRRVEGGAGLVISESTAVDHPSATRTDFFARMDASSFDAWRGIVGEVKAAGGHMLIQLFHEGAMREHGGDGPYAAIPSLSPSGLVASARASGRAATLEEISAIRDAFVRSARLAQDAGADGVEVHGAHGFLLDQFLWSATNLRTDDYGGSIEGRTRLPAEIVRGIRAACGDDFVISFRFSQWKEKDYAARIAADSTELGAILLSLRAAGVDMLHASTRRFWKPEWPESDLNLAGWAKAVSGLPTATVGSVGLTFDVTDSFAGRDGDAAIEQGLRELVQRFERDEFDLISVGRSQIADPQWVSKVRAGEWDRIRTFTREHLRDPDGSVEARV